MSGTAITKAPPPLLVTALYLVKSFFRISLLKCTFATYANSEDILLEAPAEPESKLEKKTIYIFGGSNMRSVIP